jgi:hypothetical protein
MLGPESPQLLQYHIEFMHRYQPSCPCVPMPFCSQEREVRTSLDDSHDMRSCSPAARCQRSLLGGKEGPFLIFPSSRLPSFLHTTINNQYASADPVLWGWELCWIRPPFPFQGRERSMASAYIRVSPSGVRAPEAREERECLYGEFAIPGPLIVRSRRACVFIRTSVG